MLVERTDDFKDYKFKVLSVTSESAEKLQFTIEKENKTYTVAKYFEEKRIKLT